MWSVDYGVERDAFSAVVFLLAELAEELLPLLG